MAHPVNTQFQPASTRTVQELHPIPVTAQTATTSGSDTFTPEEDAHWTIMKERFLAAREANNSLRSRQAVVASAYQEYEAFASAYREAEGILRPFQGDRRPT